MAKEKKKSKKKKSTPVDVSSQNTVSILVPDAIGDIDKTVLHGIGRLAIAAVSTFDVDTVAIIKSSQLEQQTILIPAWPKSWQDE
jgi:hypothetical protein